MNLRGPSSKRKNQTTCLPMPPGATREFNSTFVPPGATRSANSTSTQHLRPTLAAMMGAPERNNMPHLHPQKLNGSLWFDMHDCIRKDVVAAWQSDFWGPWWNYGMVPQSKIDAWWASFVQKYNWNPEHHFMVVSCWEEMVKDSIGENVSKRKRSGKKPNYIGLADWNIMQKAWEEPENVKRSKINSKNSSSNVDGFKKHVHFGGAKKHTRIAHEMGIENGGIAPAATEVVRRTHTRNGVFMDPRAKKLVSDAERLANQRLETSSDANQNEPSNQALTSTYIETAMNNKGKVYGLGSIKYLDVDPNESAAASLRRNVDMDMRMTKIEDSLSTFKRAIDVLFRINGVDPVTLSPTTRGEAVSSVASPNLSPRSESANRPSHGTQER